MRLVARSACSPRQLGGPYTGISTHVHIASSPVHGPDGSSTAGILEPVVASDSVDGEHALRWGRMSNTARRSHRSWGSRGGQHSESQRSCRDGGGPVATQSAPKGAHVGFAHLLGAMIARTEYLGSPAFIRVFFLVAFVLGMALANHSSASVTPLNRIGVRIVLSGRGEFYDTVTGDVFRPRGNKYII